MCVKGGISIPFIGNQIMDVYSKYLLEYSSKVDSNYSGKIYVYDAFGIRGIYMQIIDRYM